LAGHARSARPAAAHLPPEPVRAARSAVRTLPPLRRLTPPDAMVTLPRSVTARQLARVKHLYDVSAVSLADQGDMVIGGHRVRVLGLDLGARGFTPRFTAVSRPLWLSVLRGDMTVDFSLAGQMRNALGA